MFRPYPWSFYPPIPIDVVKRLVKRLIGMPGDTIEVKNGVLYRNNETVNETYVKEPMRYDSHAWPIPFADEDLIIGKVLFNIPPHYLYP